EPFILRWDTAQTETETLTASERGFPECRMPPHTGSPADSPLLPSHRPECHEVECRIRCERPILQRRPAADASRALGEASELPPAVFHSRHLSGDTVKVTLQPAPGGGGGSSGGGGGSLVSLGKRVTVATGSAIVSVDEDQGRWVYGALRGGMQVVRLICTAAVGQVWQ
ncbi:hypothetical protein Vretifemale_17854, partial [Volvox reticuliferus]